MVRTSLRAEWRSVRIIHGVQCVMTPGSLLMPEWSADNWDMEHTVLLPQIKFITCDG